MFLPTICWEQLPPLQAFVSIKLHQYLPPSANRTGRSTQKVLGVNRQHVWMSGSTPSSLIQVRPTSIVSRKSKSTVLYFDHLSTFLNTHGGGHRWLYFRVKFSSLWIEINVATALYENQRKLKILVWLSSTAMHVNVKGVGEPIVYSDAKLWFLCALVCVTLDEKSLGGTPRLSEWLGGGNVWRLQGCSHSPAPHVTSRPIPRTQSTRLAFSSEFNVHPLFVVAVTVIHDFFAYNIMQHFACFVNTPCFWKVDRANNFNLRMVKQYTQSLNGPDWWTTSSSLASLLPLGLPYHGSTFEHGQFVATTCPHKMSSIIPQQNLHTLKHERH